MKIVKVNEYLSFVVQKTRKGTKINCMYDGTSIGHKDPCWHTTCNVRFVAQMSIAADQMHRFEKIFEPKENLN